MFFFPKYIFIALLSELIDTMVKCELVKSLMWVNVCVDCRIDIYAATGSGWVQKVCNLRQILYYLRHSAVDDYRNVSSKILNDAFLLRINMR